MFNFRLKVKKEKTICLTRRKIYIIPTKHGMLFAVILLVMLFGSMNYNNSMGYMLTFLLSSLSVVSILHTHRTLLGLRVEVGKIQSVFAGESAQFQLLIDNSHHPARRALVWQVKPLKDKTIFNPEVCMDMPANRQAVVTLSMPTTKRGRVALERVMVYSRFPLGLFHAWAYLHFDASAIVYPAPVGSEQLPSGKLDIQGQNSAEFGSGDDFMGYRDYQFGDSPQHIDWKAVAREKGWLVKQFGGADITQVWLTEESVKMLDIESALSQLCVWVLRADHLAVQYGLKIGTQIFQPATGEQHREQCLRTLALFQHA